MTIWNDPYWLVILIIAMLLIGAIYLMIVLLMMIGAGSTRARSTDVRLSKSCLTLWLASNAPHVKPATCMRPVFTL